MALNRRRIAKIILGAAAALLLIPPACSLTSDLWLIANSDGTEAKEIIFADLDAASERAISADSLLNRPSRARRSSAPAAMILPLAPAEDLARTIPTCPGRTFEVHRRRDGVPESGATPTDLHIWDRRFLIQAAQGQARFDRIGTTRLVLLNACVQATPFATGCARNFRRPSVPRAEVIAFLASRNAVRVEPGRTCWQRPEFVAAAPLRPRPN